jgi:hypothetical protein
MYQCTFLCFFRASKSCTQTFHAHMFFLRTQECFYAEYAPFSMPMALLITNIFTIYALYIKNNDFILKLKPKIKLII